MEKTTHLARRDETNLSLELFHGTNFDVLRNILKRLPHFQALRMVWRNNPNILVHYRKEWKRRKKKQILEKKYCSQGGKKITSYKFPIFLQFLDIGFDLKYFFDIEKRR